MRRMGPNKFLSVEGPQGRDGMKGRFFAQWDGGFQPGPQFAARRRRQLRLAATRWF